MTGYEIVARYKSGRFPVLDTQFGGRIIHCRWAGVYESTSELVGDLKEFIEATQDSVA
jgi:hypothetical protein